MNPFSRLIFWLKSVLYRLRSKVKVTVPTEAGTPTPQQASMGQEALQPPRRQKPIRTYISCSKCHQNVGQKGGSPVRKVGANDYRHEACLAKMPQK